MSYFDYIYVHFARAYSDTKIFFSTTVRNRVLFLVMGALIAGYMQAEWKGTLLYGLATVGFVVVGTYLWYLFFAPFRIYKENIRIIDNLEEEKRPKLSVLFKKGENIFFQKVRSSSSDICTYRIKIINDGMELVRNVKVTFTKNIDPSPNNFYGPPFNLHFMNDNSPPFKGSEDLQSKGTLPVDVIEFDHRDNNAHRLRIVHIVAGIDRKIEPVQPYRFEIKISSDNGGETVTRRFKFDPEKKLEDMMEMLDS